MLWFLPKSCNVVNFHEKCFLHMVYERFKQIKCRGRGQISVYCVNATEGEV